jgi:hypothetical protein
LPDVTTPNCETFAPAAAPVFAESAPFSLQNETFSRDLRYDAMQPDIWYVAFGPEKTLKTDDSANAAVRSTRTFKSEVDAKLFAMQILAKGWSASAGTLNPHLPKQTVGSSQIEGWADPGLGG